ncbi:MAG: hypothetical protein RIB60_03420 [Phycisphaerales bacterium]
MNRGIKIAAGALGCFVVLGLAFCGGLGALLWALDDNWSDRTVTESQAIGDEIIDALGDYHADFGRYPERLEELVPFYLQEIRRPTAGSREWAYQTQDVCGDGFFLQFGVEPYMYPTSFYSSDEGYWSVDM